MRPLPVYDDDSDVIDADDSYHDESPPPPPPSSRATIPGLINSSSTIDPDAEYEKSTSANNTAKESKYKWHMELTSIFLFILGSVLYLVCAVYDYQWSQTLLTLPEWLRGADDDELWMRYRLEERYGDVSSMTAPTGRKLGGVRRRLMREQFWRSIDGHHDQITHVDPGSSSGRKLQQTPEEMYYDLDWECLPADIQAAYSILGYDQNSWDNEIEVSTDSLDWLDLTAAQQEAALYIGYTEMIWCEYDDPWKFPAWDDTISTEEGAKPTFFPSASPIQTPTLKPTRRPSSNPTEAPFTTLFPTISLSSKPSMFVSESPMSEPNGSSKPTNSDFIIADGSMPPRPTKMPTSNPTNTPLLFPTSNPSDFPSVYPSISPSMTPSYAPTVTLSSLESTNGVETEIRNPEELYGDEWWRDLPPEIQTAFTVLGWNETIWDAGDENNNPPSEDMDWDELTPEMQDAASTIGYTKQTWDTEEGNIGDSLDDDTVSNIANETSSTESGSVTSDADHYEDYDWVELPPNVQEAAVTLGWSQPSWDSENGTAWSEELLWDELSLEAKEAAAIFGYDQASWDANGDANLESLLISAGGSYVSQDDDYLFEIGQSNIFVSEYQILFFFASLCFLFVGVVDLAHEKAPFHLLMILAGFFGVLSAVFVEEDIRLSNIFDCLSVHLFLFEGIGLLSKDRHRELVYEGKWTKWFTIFADSQFLLGAIIDVVLAYLYLFDNTADWDMTIAFTWLFSAVLWVSCAVIYLAVFIHEMI